MENFSWIFLALRRPCGLSKFFLLPAPSLDSSSPQPGPSNGVTPLPRSALLIQLATARPRPVKAKPLDWRVQSKDWPHAGRPAHELRYSIYRDLWERGFFLSAAGKFGGDFLVYPGEFGGTLVAVPFLMVFICCAFSFFCPISSPRGPKTGQQICQNSLELMEGSLVKHRFSSRSLEFAIPHRLALECEVFLPLPPECWNCRHESQHLA